MSISQNIPSTSDDRIANNVMRHEYRLLNDTEKAQMQQVKDLGLDFYTALETLPQGREVAIAMTKIEEAVMWATRAITRPDV